MTRLVKLIVCINLLLLVLTGCEGVDFPRIEYQPTSWKADTEYIPLQEDYVLNDGHRYDIVETEDGYDLILHFMKEGD